MGYIKSFLHDDDNLAITIAPLFLQNRRAINDDKFKHLSMWDFLWCIFVFLLYVMSVSTDIQPRMYVLSIQSCNIFDKDFLFQIFKSFSSNLGQFNFESKDTSVINVLLISRHWGEVEKSAISLTEKLTISLTPDSGQTRGIKWRTSSYQ